MKQRARAVLPEMGDRVDELNIRQGQTSKFALILFLRPSSTERCRLVEICPAGSLFGLVTEGPRRKRWGKDDSHRCKGCAVSVADDSMRTSMGGRYGFCALVPLLTRASPMHFSEARGSATVGSPQSRRLRVAGGPIERR